MSDRDTHLWCEAVHLEGLNCIIANTSCNNKSLCLEYDQGLYSYGLLMLDDQLCWSKSDIQPDGEQGGSHKLGKRTTMNKGAELQ